jgi:hypothetical protein
MDFNLIPLRLNKSKDNQLKLNVDLINKSTEHLYIKPTLETIEYAKSIFDSGWMESENEVISGAATQVEGYELPEKVAFHFPFSIEVPEVYLPFLNIQILVKIGDGQKVQSIGQFTYSGLQEVLLTLYKWWGITSFGGVLPALPSPLPATCYSLTLLGTPPSGYTWDFKHQALHFPVPDGKTLPCGVIYSGSPVPAGPNYPIFNTQYWTSEGQNTFQEYMNLGYTYAQAKALFEAYYPDIFITPESHGVPYKCYRRIYSEVIESGKKFIKITKTSDTNFDIEVNGDLLLISPAIVETDYSDPDFPTFKPESNPILIRCLATYTGNPVNLSEARTIK